jgi:hypothetical protein
VRLVGHRTCGENWTLDGGTKRHALTWPAEAMFEEATLTAPTGRPQGDPENAADWAPRGAEPTLSRYLAKF